MPDYLWMNPVLSTTGSPDSYPQKLHLKKWQSHNLLLSSISKNDSFKNIFCEIWKEIFAGFKLFFMSETKRAGVCIHMQGYLGSFLIEFDIISFRLNTVNCHQIFQHLRTIRKAHSDIRAARFFLHPNNPRLRMLPHWEKKCCNGIPKVNLALYFFLISDCQDLVLCCTSVQKSSHVASETEMLLYHYDRRNHSSLGYTYEWCLLNFDRDKCRSSKNGRAGLSFPRTFSLLSRERIQSSASVPQTHFGSRKSLSLVSTSNITGTWISMASTNGWSFFILSEKRSIYSGWVIAKIAALDQSGFWRKEEFLRCNKAHTTPSVTFMHSSSANRATHTVLLEAQ